MVDAYKFEIVDVPPEAAVFVGATCGHSEIGETLMKVLPQALDHAIESGVAPKGPPFARYLCWRPTDCEFEGGFTLPHPIQSGPTVTSGVLGGCRAAHTVHVGHYSGLREAHGAAMEWIEAQGLSVGGAPWEKYVTDPEEVPNADEWRTEIFWPIA
ncbi:MAG: GyrI-like domain-containing protein [Fimbriimonadaceae bacterium]|nr:GyrI-like domain-containing protein [Chthonomonadaceae bacterium]MCO5296919.1 GyrI-like domain-containing protein [Fimbriimonadaceae bacterium]